MFSGAIMFYCDMNQLAKSRTKQLSVSASALSSAVRDVVHVVPTCPSATAELKTAFHRYFPKTINAKCDCDLLSCRDRRGFFS